jgi:hypothetical protein
MPSLLIASESQRRETQRQRRARALAAKLLPGVKIAGFLTLFTLEQAALHEAGHFGILRGAEALTKTTVDPDRAARWLAASFHRGESGLPIDIDGEDEDALPCACTE